MLILFASIASCSYRDEIDAINDRVDAIENSLEKLQKAYAEGKIVSDVKALESAEGNTGYQIHFSDGTFITLNHGRDGYAGENGQDGNDGINGTNGIDGDDGIDGKDGVTPFVRIDINGYWEVSYDEGETYTKIIDASGNPVLAIGEKGETGVGLPGVAGLDGKDGLCIRVVLSDDGYYVFETYYPNNPDNILDRIITPYKVNKSSVINSIVKNESTGVITLAMEDGSTFEFNLDVAYPTGIVVLNESLVINWSNTGMITFRLNPSDAFVNFVTSGEGANIFVDVVSEYSGRSVEETNYVHDATGFRITEVNECVDADGRVMRGQYSAIIESNQNGENVEERVCLVIKTKNSKGQEIYLSSIPFNVKNGSGNEIMSINVGDVEAVKEGNTFLIKMPATVDLKSLTPEFTSNCSLLRIKGREKPFSANEAVDFSNPVTFVCVGPDGEEQEYTVVVHFSNLPVLYMTTPSAITSKDVWTADCQMQIWNAGEMDMIYSAVNVKGRGNSTWSYPKKPYAIKLDKKAQVLGMPKHKRWCLLANWMDRTVMRNDVAFEIGRRLTGLDWTPHGEYVDVVFNGKMVGNYYLCEQIKVDENRVDIVEMESGDVSEEAITGGYLVELDTYFDGVNKFRTKHRNLPVNLKEPDEDVLVPAQLDYILGYFNNVEDLLYGGASGEVFDLIDVDSFVDWWIVQELVACYEPQWPKSSYMHKDRGGKLKAGPLWDFDWGTFQATTGWINTNSIYYGALFKKTEFVAKVKEHWNAAKPSLATIPDYIENRYALIQESAESNGRMWPIAQAVNGDEKLSVADAVERMKTHYVQRLEWMDAAISQM